MAALLIYGERHVAFQQMHMIEPRAGLRLRTANLKARYGVLRSLLCLKVKACHTTIEPSILYFGTPVILISTRNEDGTTNVAPMSSSWFLGWGCMIGLNSGSQTTLNLMREKECVLNLPSADQAHATNRLARLTGRNPPDPR